MFGIAPAKPVVGKEKAARKAGAIDMFDAGEAGEPAEKKPTIRGKRPEAPFVQPPGIPDGIPGAPEGKFDAEPRFPAAPYKPAPNRNRAPPKEAPPADAKRIPKSQDAPQELHPSFMIEKPVTDEGIIKRKDLPNPEFESSSDEEDDDKAKNKKKKSAWGDVAHGAMDVVNTAIKSPEPSKKEGMTTPDAAAGQRAVTGDLADIKRQQSKSDFGQGPMTEGKAGGAPLAAKGAWGDAGPEIAPLKIKFPVDADIKSKGGILPPRDPTPGFGPPPDPVDEGVAERLDEAGIGKRSPQASEAVSRMSESHFSEASASDREDEGEVERLSKVDEEEAEMRTDVGSSSTTVAREPLSGEDLLFGRELPRGRFYITCIEGEDFRKAHETGKTGQRIDPYIKIRLGAAERHPFLNTMTMRKQGKDPSFENEVIAFDIKDPFDYVFNADIQMRIEVWHKGNLLEECLAVNLVSVVRFLKKPYSYSREIVPMMQPNDIFKASKAKLTLGFLFEEARVGLMQFTLFEASRLRSLDTMGQQDPYVQLRLGETYIKRSKSIKNGGTKPYFAEEDVLMWLDRDNWVFDLHVDLVDEDSGPSKPIGGTHFSLIKYADPMLRGKSEQAFPLTYKKQTDPKDRSSTTDVPGGELVMKIQHFSSGILTVYVDRANKLRFPDNYMAGASLEGKRIDPYVKLIVDGLAIRTVKRTPADKDGGTEPKWGSDLVFEIVDQYLMDIEVWHQDIIGSDVLLGSAQVSLLPTFRLGSVTSWTALKQKRANGGTTEEGNISLTLSFVGPTAIAFPQCRPEVTSFDDTDRKQNVQKDVDEKALKILALETGKELTGEQKRGQEDRIAKEAATEDEFTEAEIQAAFNYIDLDNNNFVGAKEIKHILICMGEIITDEEVDMMISMVDVDGDGQVSYMEFKTLVLHPNPHLVDMHKEIRQQRYDQLAKDKMLVAETAAQKAAQAGGAGGIGLDFSSFTRQKEMSKREAKKKLFQSFVAENECNFDYVKNCYAQFLDYGKERRLNGRLSFEDFCQACLVEPIAEYRRLHGLFDNDNTTMIDYREFLLSLLNFIDVDKEVRIKFSFTMFDELKSGFITRKEVEEILRGNHMISLASVQRKAETVMKQAAQSAVGAITINELVIISKKFPNIMLPVILSDGKKSDL